MVNRVNIIRLAFVLLFVSTTLMIGGAGMQTNNSEPLAGTEIVHPVDGAIMVYVPSGPFTMGMDADAARAHARALGHDDYHAFAAEEWFPERQEYCSGFFIDKYKVTVQRWARYTASDDYKQMGEQRAKKQNPSQPDGRAKSPYAENPDEFCLYPVARIYWAEAQQYANWSRKQLPTEKQWEKAARGTDGRIYPWGNEPPTADRGAFPGIDPRMSRMVGSFPRGASPYGCMDMSGNVYEWTCEWLEPYPNSPEAARLLSYMGHEFACLRGGSFYHAMYAVSAVKRFGFRPDETYYHVGFRTVWRPPAGYFESKAFRMSRAGVKKRNEEIEALRSRGRKEPPIRF